MWSEPLDPMNTRHRAVLCAASFAIGAGLMVLNDVVLPWLTAASVAVRP